jgi:hypothetical protein
MKKLNLSAVVVLVFAGLFAASAALAVKAKDAPDKITIDQCKAKKPVVIFDHKKHFTENKIECVTCHHEQKDLKAGADVEVQKCATCHLKELKEKAQSCQEMSPTKNPFHVRCLGCHKEKKDNDPKPPTKCDDCHKKT